MTATEFSKEVENHRDLLFNFALKTTRDYQDAQDLIQESFMRAYRYRLSFDTGTNFKAWMATIIRNTFIDGIRKKKRKQLASEPIEDVLYAVDLNFQSNNGGLQKMEYQRLYDTLDNVSQLYRIPFIMHYQGYEYKEIANTLSIPIGTVKSRLNTARKKLKEQLTEA